jgi:hypothetical protein
MAMSAQQDSTYVKSDGSGDSDSVTTNYCDGPDPNLVAVSFDILELELERPRRTVNQRRHSRILVRNRKAQFIHEDQADIVEVLNISRGGMRVASYQAYRPGTILKACSDYLPGGNNIFEMVRVVNSYTRPHSGFPGEFAVEFVIADKPKSNE